MSTKKAAYCGDGDGAIPVLPKEKLFDAMSIRRDIRPWRGHCWRDRRGCFPSQREKTIATQQTDLQL
jgi:hypothetical protein